MHSTIIESNADGLGIRDLIKFAQAAEALAKQCFKASEAAAIARYGRP